MTLKVKGGICHPAEFTSTFALLDVTHGRQVLETRTKHYARTKEPGPRVVIIGRIQAGQAWGPDDGESREFGIDVERVLEVLDET